MARAFAFDPPVGEKNIQKHGSTKEFLKQSGRRAGDFGKMNTQMISGVGFVLTHSPTYQQPVETRETVQAGSTVRDSL